MDKQVLAEINPEGPRRWLAIGMMLFLGGLLIYIAFAQPPAQVIGQAFLIGVGLVALWSAHRLQAATRNRLFLTETELVDSEGVVLAKVEDIVSVDRGMFAIKPSNGFMLKLKDPAPRAWHPGLWWRIGRRLAVGGVTRGREAKPMADILAVLVSRQQ